MLRWGAGGPWPCKRIEREDDRTHEHEAENTKRSSQDDVELKTVPTSRGGPTAPMCPSLVRASPPSATLHHLGLSWLAEGVEVCEVHILIFQGIESDCTKPIAWCVHDDDR